MDERNHGKPFRSYDQNFHDQDESTVFEASKITGAEAAQRRQANSNNYPTPVSLPPHLFIPDDAQSIDISELANVPPASTVDLITFRGIKGGLVKFIGYAIFNDALMLSLINLVPLVNGVRVLPFHGNPSLKFKMGLGLGPDMQVLIPVQLDLQPQDVLIWRFTNNDVVDVAAGVRMNGYYSQSIERKAGRFGG